MSTDSIHLIGAGGHARVIIDALVRGGHPREAILLWTEMDEQVGTALAGITVGKLQENHLHARSFLVSIGSNATRERLHTSMLLAGGIAVSSVHPAAIIAADTAIRQGSFVAAGAIIGPNARLGTGCIVNHGAIVDHDCKIGDFAHIAPGATLAGNVRIGRGVLVGAGANLLPGISVGERAVIGAGAVVTENIEANSVTVGVPARRIR